jgi:[calcium/calmodulin-dependent protein kinase] kinase
MDHENIVKLYEVIDDPDNDKLYIIMELVKKGAIGSKTYWKNENVILEED